MCQSSSRMKEQCYKPFEENSLTQQTRRSSWKLVFLLCFFVLVMVSTISVVLTVQYVTQMRILERTVADLESRVSEMEFRCRLRSSDFTDFDNVDDYENESEARLFPPSEVLPGNMTGRSEDVLLHETSVMLSKDVETGISRVRRAAGTNEGGKENRNKERRGNKQRKIVSADFRLKMSDTDSYYHTIKGYTLFPWTGETRVPKQRKSTFFTTKDNGKKISITKKGLYLIYSQVTFHNSAPHNIAAIVMNGENIAQCTQSTTRIDTNVGMFANCFTAAIRYLQKGTNVEIRSLYRNRQILSRPRNTFFGLVKLA